MRFLKINLYILFSILAFDVFLFILDRCSDGRLVNLCFALVCLVFGGVCIYIFVSSLVCFLLKVFMHFYGVKKFYIINGSTCILSVFLFLINIFFAICILAYFN